MEKKCTKSKPSLITEKEEGVTNTTSNGKDIPFLTHRGNRNKHSPMTVTHCLFTNNDTNFEIQNNMPSLKEQQHNINWMFTLLLNELYDIMDELSYIKWELVNGQNPTVNNDLNFDPFRTIGRF